MTITVNGHQEDFSPGATVADLLAALGCDGDGTAVAVNEQIVAKPAWGVHHLVDGDTVEILTAVQGG